MKWRLFDNTPFNGGSWNLKLIDALLRSLLQPKTLPPKPCPLSPCWASSSEVWQKWPGGVPGLGGCCSGQKRIEGSCIVCVGAGKESVQIPHSRHSAIQPPHASPATPICHHPHPSTSHIPLIRIKGRGSMGEGHSWPVNKDQGYLLAGPAAPAPVTLCSPSFPPGRLSARHMHTWDGPVHLQVGGQAPEGLLLLPSLLPVHPMWRAEDTNLYCTLQPLLLLPFCPPQVLPRHPDSSQGQGPWF